MKTKLSDEKLIKLGYEHNIYNTYLFKTLGGFNAVFIDCITREVTFECEEKYKKEATKELIMED